MKNCNMKTIMLIALLTGPASPSLADHAALYDEKNTGDTEIRIMLFAGEQDSSHKS